MVRPRALAARGGPPSAAGGRLIFLTNSHLSALCVPAEEGVAGDWLVRGHREAYHVRWPAEELWVAVRP